MLIQSGCHLRVVSSQRGKHVFAHLVHHGARESGTQHPKRSNLEPKDLIRADPHMFTTRIVLCKAVVTAGGNKAVDTAGATEAVVTAGNKAVVAAG